MESLKRLWQQASDILSRKLPENDYKLWMSSIVPLRRDKDCVTLGVHYGAFSEWLEKNYKEIIAQALSEAAGETIKVFFEVSAKAEPTVPAVAEEKPAPAGAVRKPEESATPPKPAAAEVRFNKKYMFDTFVVGEGNEFAYSASVAVSKKPGVDYNPLFIYGPTGVGKTHLMQAIANDVMARKRNVCVEYCSTEEFLNDFITAIKENKYKKFRDKYRKVDVLLIDDVHFFTGKDKLQEEFFHTFNTLYNDHKQIVLASDREPKDIDGLEKRLVSRFESGLVIDIKPPDLETRIAILRKKQEAHEFKLDDEILTLLATRIRSNVRRLEGAMNKLVSFASIQKKKMTTARAEELLQSLFEEEAEASARPVVIADIQKVVAEYYDLRISDMTSPGRSANVAGPRQVAMYLARTLTTLSNPAVGDAFGRTHATVIHAVQVVTKKRDSDPAYKKTLELLERRLKGVNGK